MSGRSIPLTWLITGSGLVRLENCLAASKLCRGIKGWLVWSVSVNIWSEIFPSTWAMHATLTCLLSVFVSPLHLWDSVPTKDRLRTQQKQKVVPQIRCLISAFKSSICRPLTVRGCEINSVIVHVALTVLFTSLG